MSAQRQEILESIGRQCLGAIIRTAERRSAADAMRAAVEGGFRLVEFTLNTPDALELITEFRREDGLLVGAGTVMSPRQVRQAADAGAQFIVSPTWDEAVIRETLDQDLVSIPGTYTPSEMVAASRLGADMVKLFPAPGDIAGYVRQVIGPLPQLKIFPTAGVSIDNFLDILSAGAAGVGFVSSLFRPDEIEARNFAAIEARAREIMQRFHDRRGS